MVDQNLRREYVKVKEFKSIALEEEDSFLSTEEIKDKIKQLILQRLKSQELKIPMLPHVAMRVMEIAGDQNADIKQIAIVLKQDQQLTGKLIKIANSPVYAGMSKITSIQRAVMQVGVKMLRDLLLSVSVQGTIFRNKKFKDLMDEIWKHSLCTAYICQQLAQTIKLDNEYAFLCGLMHDVGKPLLIDILADVQRENPDDIFLNESLVRELLSDFHQNVGGMIAVKWGFPSLLSDAIAYHHRYDEAKSSIQMANLVHVADLFHYHLGFEVEKSETDISQQKAPYDLGLSPDQIKDLEIRLTDSLPLFLSGFSD